MSVKIDREIVKIIECKLNYNEIKSKIDVLMFQNPLTAQEITELTRTLFNETVRDINNFLEKEEARQIFPHVELIRASVLSIYRKKIFDQIKTELNLFRLS